MATRNVGGIAPKKSSVSGKVPTGSTVGEIFSNITDQKLFGYDGLVVFEYGTKSFLALSGGTVSGNTSFPTLSATTFYSGSTLLSSVITSMITGVTSGITGTGGASYWKSGSTGAFSVKAINDSG